MLKPGGVAFLHHSNLDAIRRRSVMYKVRWLIMRLSRTPVTNPHWRASSMSAEKMRTFVEGAGMMCVQQEIGFLGGGAGLV